MRQTLQLNYCLIYSLIAHWSKMYKRSWLEIVIFLFGHFMLLCESQSCLGRYENSIFEDCPADWWTFKDSCYKPLTDMHSRGAGWNQRYNCRKLGAHPISFETPEETEVVLNDYFINQVPPGKQSDIYRTSALYTTSLLHADSDRIWTWAWMFNSVSSALGLPSREKKIWLMHYMKDLHRATYSKCIRSAVVYACWESTATSECYRGTDFSDYYQVCYLVICEKRVDSKYRSTSVGDELILQFLEGPTGVSNGIYSHTLLYVISADDRDQEISYYATEEFHDNRFIRSLSIRGNDTHGEYRMTSGNVTSSTMRNKNIDGLRLYGQFAIFAYVTNNFEPFDNTVLSGYHVIPSTTYGYEYYAVTWINQPFILITAHHKNTTVAVTLPHNVGPGLGYSSYNNRDGIYNTTYEYKGHLYYADETFNVQLSSDLSSFYMFTANDGDLTGTKLISSTMFTVLSGSIKSHVETNEMNSGTRLDDMVEQLYPVVQWGRRYVFTSAPRGLDGGQTGSVIRIVAYSVTSVSIHCVSIPDVASVTLVGGEHLDLIVSQPLVPCFVSASDKVQVALISTATSPDSPTGAPSMVIVPPLELWNRKLEIVAIDSSISTPINELVIVTHIYSTNNLRLDDEITEFNWTIVEPEIEYFNNSLSYAFTSVRVSPGYHKITSVINGSLFMAILHSFLRSSVDGPYDRASAIIVGPLLQRNIYVKTAECNRSEEHMMSDVIDNDCDGLVDEEVADGHDNDGDGMIDEDVFRPSKVCEWYSSLQKCLPCNNNTKCTACCLRCMWAPYGHWKNTLPRGGLEPNRHSYEKYGFYLDEIETACNGTSLGAFTPTCFDCDNFHCSGCGLHQDGTESIIGYRFERDDMGVLQCVPDGSSQDEYVEKQPWGECRDMFFPNDMCFTCGNKHPECKACCLMCSETKGSTTPGFELGSTTFNYGNCYRWLGLEGSVDCTGFSCDFCEVRSGYKRLQLSNEFFTCEYETTTNISVMQCYVYTYLCTITTVQVASGTRAPLIDSITDPNSVAIESNGTGVVPYGTVATYTCTEECINPKHGRIPQQTVCGGNDYWREPDGSTGPVCIPKSSISCLVPNIPNSNIGLLAGTYLQYEETVHFACEDRYELTNDKGNKMNVTCHYSGVLIPPLEACQLIPLCTVETGANSYSNPPDGTLLDVGKVVTHNCTEKYEYLNNRNQLTQTCIGMDTWDVQLELCHYQPTTGNDVTSSTVAAPSSQRNLNKQDGNGSSAQTVMYAGIGVGSFLALAAALSCCIFMLLRRRRGRGQTDEISASSQNASTRTSVNSKGSTISGVSNISGVSGITKQSVFSGVSAISEISNATRSFRDSELSNVSTISGVSFNSRMTTLSGVSGVSGVSEMTNVSNSDD